MFGAGREHPEQTFHGLTGVCTALYSVLLPRMAAKIPVEPWKARPGMHASLCHNPDQGHLEPLISVQRNPTKPAGSGARPKAQPPPDWVQHQFTTNLIWFFTVAAYQYKLKYHHLHTAHDHLQN